MLSAMTDTFGNPSSLHRLGLKSEKAVKSARADIAAAIGCTPAEVIFTACGTESDNTVLFGTARAKRRIGKRIITTKVEHPAILEPCKRLESEGFEVVYLDVDSEGFVSADAVAGALTEDTILVSIMAVNNESGCIMPIEEIGRKIAEYNKAHGTGILFHSDMVQSFGKVRFNMSLVDMASFSAHKIHGPKGIGALYVKKGVNIEPFLLGGGQEGHFRSGTENVPSIIGFGTAARLSNERFDERVAAMRSAKERLLSGLSEKIGNIRINTPNHDSVCSVLNVSFIGTRGEVILHTLEQSEIYVSTGSACSSNHSSKGGSHVLRAMGLSPKEIEGAIRFSFSEFNTLEEMDAVIDAAAAAVEKFRKLGSFR
jgi:cysteine desulfurase